MKKLESSLLKIVSITATSRFASEIDIEKLARMLKNSIYEPEMFPGLIYPRESRESTIILFSSGKITSTSTNSEYAAKAGILKTASELSSLLNLSLKLDEILIENLVIKSNVNTKLDLVQLKKRIPNAKYDPKRFPGLFYMSDKGGAIIFSNGKIALSGIRKNNEVSELLTEIFDKIENS